MHNKYVNRWVRSLGFHGSMLANENRARKMRERQLDHNNSSNDVYLFEKCITLLFTFVSKRLIAKN